MFKKSSRIDKKDVGKVIKEGVAYHSPSFLLKVLKNTEEKTLFAVVVSKKVSKTAVGRNKNKRRVREVLKKALKEKKEHNFYIVILKKDLNKSLFGDIKNELIKLLALRG